MPVLFVLLLFSSLCFGVTPVNAEKMSVSQAYKALHHQQTQFKSSIAQMSADESKYLDHLFFVTDLAFRERMVMLQAFRAGKDKKYIDKYNKEIANLLGSFSLIDPPTSNLKNVETHIISAIDEQREFFNMWHAARGTSQYSNLQKNFMSNKNVQSSHRKLLQAYSLLKKHYPKEGSHNQQSFFDHLCALDFI
ncbi:MAG: hypothetical protein ACRBB3_09855 [Alphaproteobacteria bacterium]